MTAIPEPSAPGPATVQEARRIDARWRARSVASLWTRRLVIFAASLR